MSAPKQYTPAAAAPPSKPPGEFTVRISQGLIDEAVGAEPAGSDLLPPQVDPYSIEALTAAESEAARQGALIVAHEEGERRERALAAAIDALHKREYMAPAQPMACKAEREAALACYKAHEKRSPGDAFFACEAVVRELDECANLVRLAAVSKIVPGSLP